MIRKLALTLAMVFLASTFAYAADGYHADLEMIIKMDPAMFGGMEDTEGMEEMQNMSFDGKIYWTDDAMRFEMNMGMLGGSMTTLIDYVEMVAYTLDDDSKTAMMIDLNEQAEMMEESGMPDFQPEQLFTNWEDTLALMRDMPGVTIKELGKDTVSGRNCEKIDLVMDMTEMMKAEGLTDEEIAEMSEMGGMDNFSGTFWVDSEFELPIRMDMNMMGTDLTWLLNNIVEWTADPALLSVPDGYEIMSFDDMMAEMMEGMEIPE